MEELASLKDAEGSIGNAIRQALPTNQSLSGLLADTSKLQHRLTQQYVKEAYDLIEKVNQKEKWLA